MDRSRIEVLAYRLQSLSLNSKLIESIIEKGSKEVAKKCTETIDPAVVRRDVLDVIFEGLDHHTNELQDKKIDPLIGYVQAKMTEEEMLELEEAETQPTSTFVRTDEAIQEEETAAKTKDSLVELRTVFKKYDLSDNFTKTAVRLLSAIKVRQLADDIRAVYPQFDTEHVKIIHSKTGVPTKEDLIAAIVTVKST